MPSRKTSSSRWSNDDVIKFLECYKQQECLWNTNLKDNRIRKKREKAYEMLRLQMGFKNLSIADVKNKIRGIRSTYNDEQLKVLLSKRAGTEKVYTPKIFWDKKLQDKCHVLDQGRVFELLQQNWDCMGLNVTA